MFLQHARKLEAVANMDIVEKVREISVVRSGSVAKKQLF
jgi:hypothetical protein